MMVDMYVKGDKWVLTALLEGLPNLTSFGRLNDLEDPIQGKKRRFIEKKQYFTKGVEEVVEKKAAEEEEQAKHYLINVYEGEGKLEKGKLFDPEDPFHARWATETRMVNLLREERDDRKQSRKGVYVEFEKKISDDEQIIKNEVTKQVQKYLSINEEQLLYETGLEKNVWYRRTKGQDASRISSSQHKPPARLEQALDKQV